MMTTSTAAFASNISRHFYQVACLESRFSGYHVTNVLCGPTSRYCVGMESCRDRILSTPNRVPWYRIQPAEICSTGLTRGLQYKYFKNQIHSLIKHSDNFIELIITVISVVWQQALAYLLSNILLTIQRYHFAWMRFIVFDLLPIFSQNVTDFITSPIMFHIQVQAAVYKSLQFVYHNLSVSRSFLFLCLRMK